MLYVIALGGNALLKRGESLEASTLKKNVAQAAQIIARFCQNHQVVIVHGNGPQVGLLALQADAYKSVAPYPLDILDAESQGMIGYLLQQSIHNLTQKNCVTLMTQVLVDPSDPAFQKPSKFIGPVYDPSRLSELKSQYHWTWKMDGAYLRRVVPSPKPLVIQELPVIQHLLSQDTLVITGGGGGIPCVLSNNTLKGIEAVIDKDLTAALLAKQLHADHLVILTDVDGVYEHWETPQKKRIHNISSEALSKMSFPAGSMGPKVAAAVEFVSSTGRSAYIGGLDTFEALIAGRTGTQIQADPL